MSGYLDPDLQAEVDEANRSRAEAREIPHGNQLTRSERLRRTTIEFEAQLIEQRAQREQARRHGLTELESYDKAVLAAEAAVIDLCIQLFDLELRESDGDPAQIAERLERGLLATRAERNEAVADGWAYRREKKWLAARELAWERAVRHVRRAGFV